jgi:thiamine biosynthesis lipoprotein
MNVWYQDGFFMGTRFNLLIPGLDESQGEALFIWIETELRRLEKMLSVFDPESSVSRVNKIADEQAVIVQDELLEIVSVCQDHWVRTDGWFDVGIGMAIEEHLKPSEDVLIKQYREKRNPGIKDVEVDKKNKTIRFTCPGVKLDFGGFGKGYALDKVVAILKEHRIKNALISFGESSVYALGSHPFGNYWPVSLSDARQKTKVLKALTLRDQAVSTSSNVFRDHLIHPRNGFPQKIKKSVTVVTASSAEAEVLSTALMLADEEPAQRILQSYPVDQVVMVDYSSGYGRVVFQQERPVRVLK